MQRILTASAALLAAVLPALALFAAEGGLRRETAEVVAVFDGDTIAVRLNGREETVRLIGLDAPETGTAGPGVQFFGTEATFFVLRTLQGRRVRLEFEPPERPGGGRDRYGRLLAYVITPEGGNVNRELVRRGYARVFTKHPFTYQQEFLQAQQAAKREGIGIWDRAGRAAWGDPSRRGMIIGNIRSGIYHLPGQYGHDRVRERNRIYFTTEEEARSAGFRKARN